MTLIITIGIMKERYMYYNLLNKNVISAVLLSLMVASNASVSYAQGAVSLVPDDTTVPQDNSADIVNQDENFDELGFTIDAEIPDTIEDEIIPFDNDALISPESPSSQDNAPVAKEDVVTVEESSDASPESLPEANAVDNNVANTEPVSDENQNTDETFNLGLAPLPANDTSSDSKTKSDDGKMPSIADNTNPLITNAEVLSENKGRSFANSILDKVDNELFAQMSDIEKQTTLLTLELRREKIRNEIEAVKAQRLKAEEEKKAVQKEKELKDFEWKKEQEAKVFKEQQLLKEKEIELEKIKQRKALNSYMNKMLEDKQVWMEENAKLLKKIQEIEANRNEIAENFKKKLNDLTTLSNNLIQSANSAKSNHDRTVASLTAQNIQLKKRLEAEVEALQNAQQAPFDASLDAELSNNIAKEDDINIAQEYAILDIIGKGDELFAKLINKDGSAFVARKGTVLQSGHTVEQITQSYISFSKNGTKQYLYTGTSIEPERMMDDGSDLATEVENTVNNQVTSSAKIGDSSAPTLGAGMFVK